MSILSKLGALISNPPAASEVLKRTGANLALVGALGSPGMTSGTAAMAVEHAAPKVNTAVVRELAEHVGDFQRIMASRNPSGVTVHMPSPRGSHMATDPAPVHTGASAGSTSGHDTSMFEGRSPRTVGHSTSSEAPTPHTRPTDGTSHADNAGGTHGENGGHGGGQKHEDNHGGGNHGPPHSAERQSFRVRSGSPDLDHGPLSIPRIGIVTG